MKCEICGKDLKGPLAIPSHVNRMHKLTSQQYYDLYIKKDKEGLCLTCGQPTLYINFAKGYEKYCSLRCDPNNQIKSYFCNICKKEFKNTHYLSTHLSRIHKIKAKDYYDKNFKKSNEGICLTCGKSTKFLDLTIGYAKHCNMSCSRLDPAVQNSMKQNFLNKYGVENPFCLPEVQKKSIQKAHSKEVNQKRKQTCLNKYGATNPLGSKEIRNKIKETNLERYGVEYASQSQEIQNRIKNTNLKKFGVNYVFESDEIKKKMQNTWKIKYGTTFASQSPIIRNKVKQTNLEKYGYENISQVPEIQNKMKQNTLEKYGVEYNLQRDDIREKIKQTSLNKYGVTCPFNQPHIHKKAIENAAKPDVRKRVNNTIQKNQRLDNELNDPEE